jgi:RHS repeat-associated core domain
MTKDLNKGISSIAYNSLNLPQTVNISNSINTYVYSAMGTKLSVSQPSKKTDYVGNMIYENNTLKRILVDGGYYEPSTSKYYFYLTDHLGNNRVVADQTGAVAQTNHYYPFGMSFADGVNTDKQPYKYNGKELDTDRGLNWYDYSARQYDGIRFTTVDPLAEKYYSISPYAYCLNNPVKYVDPDGRFVATVIGTIAGGVVGAYKAYKSGTDMWAGAAEGAVAGAITGATVDLAVAATVATGGGALVVVGTGVVAGAVGGAAGGIAGDVTGQIVTDVRQDASLSNAVNNVSTENFASKAASGAVTGAVSGVTGGAVGAVGKAAATSTKAVQATMSNNITTTATTLTSQGASQGTVNTAVNSVTKGMSTAGSNTVNTMIKVEAATATATETTIKVAEEQLKMRGN